MDSFFRTVMNAVEENPETVFAFGYTVTLEFANKIKAAVNEYYGIPNTVVSLLSDSDVTLEDNVLVGDWKSEYTQYNCYAYAIDYSQGMNPGDFSGTGDENGDGWPDYIFTGSVSDAADCVRSDLDIFGYTVTKFTTTRPNTSVTAHTKLICIRTDVDGVNTRGYCDYHFMKKGEDGNWYHKPGATNPLRYLYTPSNGTDWVCEGYDGTEETYFRYTWMTYDSEIYYIEYTIPDDWAWKYCGNGQHIQTCSVCGDTKGSALACVYKNGSTTCSLCGNFDDYIGLNRNKLLQLLAE